MPLEKLAKIGEAAREATRRFSWMQIAPQYEQLYRQVLGTGRKRRGRTAMNQGTIVVFRIQLLPPSETFIVAQAAAMRRFSPLFRRLAQDGWDRAA